MRVRKALLPDVETIHDLILTYSQQRDGELIERTVPELCENVRDFFVVEDESGVFGCGALHLYGTHLAEVRSICVRPGASGRGGGRLLLEALIDEAEEQSVQCVCLFTRAPGFFARFGFKEVAREELPDKIYKDCVNCAKQDACDEVPMYRGELPHFAILAPPEAELKILRERIKPKR
jgi:amino-acid N-acetyltransferase